MDSALRALVSEAKSRGIKTLSVVHRRILKPTKTGPGALHNDDLTTMASSAGFAVVDPGPALVQYLDQRQVTETALWIKPDDFHPNAVAHRIIAEQIAPVLNGVVNETTAGRTLPSH